MPVLRPIAATLALSLMLAGTALDGSVSAFEDALRTAYGDYRAALFQTNSGNQDGAAKAVATFRAEWAALIAANPEAPPQYADDPGFTASLAAVATIADRAAAEVAAGKLAAAHETLEPIRDELGALRARNGVVTFSDRMNAYHAWMERVLADGYDGLSPAGMGRLREDAAVLAYLAADIAAHPPADAGDPAYAKLLDGMTASTAALVGAVRADDAAAARQALQGLKPPYSKLFLKFG